MTPATAVDLSPLADLAIQVAGLIVTGLVGWASVRVAAYAHVSTQNAMFKRVVDAADRAIAYGQQVAQQKAAQDSTVDVQTEAQAQAVGYVVTKLPGYLKALGMTPQHVSDLVLSKLPPP